MKHADVREMLALHALGAMPERDAGRVEDHLDECEECRSELIDLEEAVVELAGAAPPLTPSQDVTRRILDAAARSPGRERQPARPDAGRGRRGTRRGGVRPFWIVTAIAAGAVVAALVASQISLYRRLERATAMLAHGRELLDFMSSPDVVTVALAPADSAPDARALVSYDRRSGRVAVVSFDLPPPPAGTVYQLWLIADDVRPGGILPAERRGAALIHARSLPESGGGAPLFAITVEPSPGAPDPTGDIVLLGGPARPPRAAR